MFIDRREIFIIEEDCDLLKKTVYYINCGRKLEHIKEIKLEFNSLKKTILNFKLRGIFYFKNDKEVIAYNRNFNNITKEFDYFKISFIDIKGEIRNSIYLDDNF